MLANWREKVGGRKARFKYSVAPPLLYSLEKNPATRVFNETRHARVAAQLMIFYSGLDFLGRGSGEARFLTIAQRLRTTQVGKQIGDLLGRHRIEHSFGHERGHLLQHLLHIRF